MQEWKISADKQMNHNPLPTYFSVRFLVCCKKCNCYLIVDSFVSLAKQSKEKRREMQKTKLQTKLKNNFDFSIQERLFKS